MERKEEVQHTGASHGYCTLFIVVAKRDLCVILPIVARYAGNYNFLAWFLLDLQQNWLLADGALSTSFHLYNNTN